MKSFLKTYSEVFESAQVLIWYNTQFQLATLFILDSKAPGSQEPVIIFSLSPMQLPTQH